ncbi:hypothetical protein AC578_4916 [Pseudocercospora eumusae]|uniref:Uncharacterized protein n=1 Tax=Pseudocercospora eumusae TaxID=321146 RepID=A0A139HNW6_9PEZI|nr:hypothetical protein AC578_4916 [Pseudocercospora eumusae]
MAPGYSGFCSCCPSPSSSRRYSSYPRAALDELDSQPQDPASKKAGARHSSERKQSKNYKILVPNPVSTLTVPATGFALACFYAIDIDWRVYPLSGLDDLHVSSH